jgi:hypothetical protein
MSDLDGAARYALKMRPAEKVSWLVPGLDEDLAFRRWLDTEMIAFPGEPKRRCDTVAELVSRSGKQAPWALVCEVEARPRATIRERLLEYQLRVLRKKRHGPRQRDRYQVAGLVLLLTGKMKALEIHAALPGTNLLLHYKAQAVNLSTMSAAGVLERIAGGELGRTVLAWAPLMQGGGEPAVASRWVELARQEPDPQFRADYAGLALVFAECARCRPVWEKALEGWEMEQSAVIKGWKDQGHKEGLREGLREGRQEGSVTTQRASLVKLLRTRFRNEPLDDVLQKVEQTSDLDLLGGWFDRALEALSFDAVRQMILGAPPAP